MDKVNLDINTYTLSELESLLKLSASYTEEDILTNKEKIGNQITRSNINQIKKEDLYLFLDNVKNKLIGEYLKSIKSIKPSGSIINSETNYDGNHFIVEKQPGSSEYKSIIKKTFTIDSMYRANYDIIPSHDFIIELPETITNALTMSISSIEIPLTYHNISEKSNNNSFRIELNTKDHEDNITNDQNWNIILATGLYESLFTSSSQRKAQNIEEQINTQIALQVTGSTTGASDLSSNLRFRVDPNSGFGMFTYANKFAIGTKLEEGKQIVINFNVDNNTSQERCAENYIYQKLGWQLGFRGETSIIDSSSATIVGAIHSPDSAIAIAPGICHISYPRYIYVCIDDYQTSSRNFFAVAANSTIAPNIVARINILSCLEDKTAFKSASAPGDYLYSNKHVREYFGPTNIKKLRIQLLDEYGRQLSLNNMDWSFVASWESVYN